MEVAQRGGTAGAAMNAANEAAVAAFCRGELRFDEIVPFVRRHVETHPFVSEPTLEDLKREMNALA